MSRKLALMTILIVVILGIHSWATQVSMVIAGFPSVFTTLYIRADGSIEPLSAPIQRDGEVFTFTGNFTTDVDGLIIERSNIVLNGNGCRLSGSYYAQIANRGGIILRNLHNVTIKNLTIVAFANGIAVGSATNITISQNHITNHRFNAITFVHSSNNIVSENQLHAHNTLVLSNSSYNIISGNNVGAAERSLVLQVSSSNNTIYENNLGLIDFRQSSYNLIQQNTISQLILYYSSDNRFYHNNITRSSPIFAWHGSAQKYASMPNFWDNGYPSGGNYWKNLKGADFYRGTYQNETGNDGIVDQAYVIDEDNVDYYPIWIDSDGDRLHDGWEEQKGLNPFNMSDAQTDSFDHDGLSNLDEYIYNTDLRKLDTDEDGLNDGVEVHVFGTDPTKEDTNGDGTVDLFEASAAGFTADAVVLPEGWLKVHVFWQDHTLDVVANSSVVGVEFNPVDKQLFVDVDGIEGTGVCNFSLPKSLVPSSLHLRMYLDNQPIRFSWREDSYRCYVSITYTHSTHEILLSYDAYFDYTPFIAAGALIGTFCVAAILVLQKRRKASNSPTNTQ